jgi:hypothetical protein
MIMRRTLTAFALVVACVVSTAGPARADIFDNISVMTDHFNDDPGLRWTITSTGNGAGGFQAGVGFIYHNMTTGWTDISRNVTLSPIDNSHTCRAYVDLYANGNGGQVVVNIEVINPENWTYLAKGSGGVSARPIQHFTPKWSNGPRTVVFRVSLFGHGDQTLWIDNMFISCEW